MARPKTDSPEARERPAGPENAGEPGARALAVAQIALPLALVAATLATFWPCLSQGFVDIDDDANFTLNYLFRGLSREQLSWMWSLDGFHYGHWHPLTWTTFGLDYVLYGLDGAKFHRVGLWMHAATVVALYWVALALLRWVRGWLDEDIAPSREIALRVCAAFAALAWGLHPLRVESVAWLTERRDVLSTFFLLLSVLAYLRLCAEPERWARWLALSLLAYAASLLCKAWGMTLPALLVALDLLVLRRRSADSPRPVSMSRLVHEKLAYVPLAVFCAVQAARAQGQIAAVVGLGEHGLWKRIAQASYGLVWYPLKTLWPTKLSCLYLLELDFRPDKPVYLAAQAAVVVVTLALVFSRRRFSGGIATWVCYGVLVSPVLGLLQSGSQKVADRYAYLAAIPFSMLAAAGVLALILRARDDSGVLRRAWSALGASAVLAGVLGVASHAQTLVWKDSETLFRNAVEVEPDNYFVLHNLAAQYWKKGNAAGDEESRRKAWSDALEVEKRSVAAHPGKGNEEARYAVGELSRMTGDVDAAIEAWRGALAVAPDHLRSLQQLTAELIRRKDFAGAIAVCDSVVAAKPAFVEGWTMLANVYTQQGQTQKALETLRRAVSVMPNNAAMQNAYGKALQAAGRAADAEPFLTRAVQLDDHNIEYATDLGALFVAMNRTQDAISLLQQVVNQAPQHPRARELLDRALGKH
jgi:tetratricopeptide (TPR) repeat protein